MKTIALTLLAVVCAACSVLASQTSSVIYQKAVVYSTPVHVVYVDLNDPDVKVTVAIAKRGRGSSEPASSIVSRTRPTAAITGTFFDTRTLIPTGDILICGTRIHSGCVGSALRITQDNKASIAPFKFRRSQKDGDFETILQAGPTLVSDGVIALNPRAEGFRDPRLFTATRKTAVGVTPSNKLILLAVNKPISMRGLAKIIHRLGATQAILLDGGSSTAMYARGRFVSRPLRKLTNLLLVYERAESYRMAAGQLAPTMLSSIHTPAPASLPADGPWYRRLALATSEPHSTILPVLDASAAGTAPLPEPMNSPLPSDYQFQGNYHIKNYLQQDDNIK